MFRNLSPAALAISGRQSELIELALSFGFKGLDLDLVEFAATVKTHGLAHARRLIDSARLKLGTFRLPLVWDEDEATHQAGLPALEEAAMLAKQIGLTRVTTVISPANDLRPYHENFEFHRRRLGELSARLAGFNLRLGLEFRASAELRRDRAFQFIHTFDALATLVSMVRAPNLGVVVDLFELQAAGNSLDDVRKLGGDKVVALIAADAAADVAAAELSPDDRLLPGETGSIDLAAALTFLAESGFDGPVTPSVCAEKAKGTKREALVKTAGERIGQAWAVAGLNPAGKLVPVGAKK